MAISGCKEGRPGSNGLVLARGCRGGAAQEEPRVISGKAGVIVVESPRYIEIYQARRIRVNILLGFLRG